MANKSSSWFEGWRKSSGWKTSLPAQTPKVRKNADWKVRRWRDGTRSFHEAGLQIEDRVSWQKSLKESQKREDELVQQLWTTRKDEGRKEELEDCFDVWVRCCAEAEAAEEQKSLVEEEFKQCFERYKATWEFVEKKTEAAAVPEQQHKESTLGRGLQSPYGLGQTWLGPRRTRVTSSDQLLRSCPDTGTFYPCPYAITSPLSVVSMQISIKRRRQFSSVQRLKNEFRAFWAQAVRRRPHTRLRLLWGFVLSWGWLGPNVFPLVFLLLMPLMFLLLLLR